MHTGRTELLEAGETAKHRDHHRMRHLPGHPVAAGRRLSMHGRRTPLTLPKLSRTGRKTGAVFLLLIVVIAIGSVTTVREAFLRGLQLLATGQLAEFRRYLLSLGSWAPIMSVLLMVGQATAIPIPVTGLMIANGLVFGLLRGMEISLVGGLIGAMAAYVIGRGVGRSIAERLLSPRSLDAADRLITKRGGWAVVLGRLVPGIPCDPVSYVAGAMRMPIVPFVLLTIVGLLPAVFSTAFVGAEVVGEVRPGYWLVAIVLTVALGIVWWLVRRGRQRPGPTADPS
jgi:uncharacterized membrane protein YdjX (TVP38/TMEM64 family)